MVALELYEQMDASSVCSSQANRNKQHDYQKLWCSNLLVSEFRCENWKTFTIHPETDWDTHSTNDEIWKWCANGTTSFHFMNARSTRRNNRHTINYIAWLFYFQMGYRSIYYCYRIDTKWEMRMRERTAYTLDGLDTIFIFIYFQYR